MISSEIVPFSACSSALSFFSRLLSTMQKPIVSSSSTATRLSIINPNPLLTGVSIRFEDLVRHLEHGEGGFRLAQRLGDAHRDAVADAAHAAFGQRDVAAAHGDERVRLELERQRVADFERHQLLAAAASASYSTASTAISACPISVARWPSQIGSRPNFSPMNICSSTSRIGSIVA